MSQLLVRQPKSETDTHPRYKTADGVFEVTPGYAGHGYSKPTHYIVRKNGEFVTDCDTLREAREEIGVLGSTGGSAK